MTAPPHPDDSSRPTRPDEVDSRCPGPILVTGAGGLVGKAIARVLGADAIPLAHPQLDICDAAAVGAVLERHRPFGVINAAAWADVDRCERDPEGAFRVNALGAEVLARACSRHRVRLVHVSTDYVFGGDAAHRYHPGDPGSPVNRYGESKLEGEHRVRTAWPEAAIARTAWVYGRDGRGFGCSLPFRLAAGERVEAIADRSGHATYVMDLAERLVRLVLAGVPGIHHVVNRGPVSWYEFADRLSERLGWPPGQVTPVSRSTLPATLAPRPVRIAVLESGIDSLGVPPLRPWQEAQDAFIRELIRVAGGAP